jgi:hypothetical protein
MTDMITLLRQSEAASKARTICCFRRMRTGVTYSLSDIPAALLLLEDNH